MVSRCGACHRQHVCRRLVLEIIDRGRTKRRIEVRVCGACTAALLDTFDIVGAQSELPQLTGSLYVR